MVTKCWDEWAPGKGGGAQSDFQEHTRSALGTAPWDNDEQALRLSEIAPGVCREKRVFTLQGKARALAATALVAVTLLWQSSKGDA